MADFRSEIAQMYLRTKLKFIIVYLYIYFRIIKGIGLSECPGMSHQPSWAPGPHTDGCIILIVIPNLTHLTIL